MNHSRFRGGECNVINKYFEECGSIDALTEYFHTSQPSPAEYFKKYYIFGNGLKIFA
jgi:hypothetical protein